MLFGTSGIRGIYGKDITEELAYKIANVFADQNVVIGRDTRTSGLALQEACTQAVVGRTKDAYLLGIVPTPTLALATLKKNCLGIMITASHNPSEYNGFKLFREGKEITRDEERDFENRFNKGVIKEIESHNAAVFDDKLLPEEYRAIEDHKGMIKRLVDCNAIAKRKLKVVVDCNGAAATITPDLLRELGCHVISVNAELEGFNRASEPNTENLQKTAAIVKAVNADLGIAHDGDGDRCVVIDETGQVLPLDAQLAIMIENELVSGFRHQVSEKKPKNKKPMIISTVEASLLVRETCERNGADIKITPVSTVYISEELEKNNALFGGEPCGEYVFANAGHHAPDGILAAAKFVEIAANSRLSELRKKYKQYPMIREKFKCEKKDKYQTIREIIKRVKINGKRNEEDGLRVDEKDGWFLIRASGTEPIIRLTMEYKDKKRLEERANEVRDVIKVVLNLDESDAFI